MTAEGSGSVARCVALDAVLVSIDPASGKLWKGALYVAPHERRVEVSLVRAHAVDRPRPTPGRDELVARLRSVLVNESTPDERTALLIAVLGRPEP